MVGFEKLNHKIGLKSYMGWEHERVILYNKNVDFIFFIQDKIIEKISPASISFEQREKLWS